MKRFILLLLVLAVVGCDQPTKSVKKKSKSKVRVCTKCSGQTGPTANPPLTSRYKNWTRTGSCGYASTANALAYLGKHQQAAYVRANYAGGSSISGNQARVLDRLGVDYVLHTSGDPRHLEQVSRTRRMAIVKVHSGHIVNFAGFNGGKGYILNNNTPKGYEEWNKDSLIRAWRHYGGVALTPVDRPPPPSKWHWSS